jgi:2-polyprenyl-6-methoxyphenol hydroxylase-like FAD-dependent oxidoreductase
MENVLIVGAGPTGLALALWLTGQGIGVRIIDKSAGPGETSRAMVVQARTLELYRQLDLADQVIAAGHKNPAINMWVGGKRRARVAFGDAGAHLTPYPFVLVYPQDQHERFLVERLAALGRQVERNTELLSFIDEGDQLSARLRLPDGSEQTCQARYLAGCDGARSPVRHQLGVDFAGGTYQHVFYVADVEVDGLAPAGEVHIALEQADFALLLAYGADGDAGSADVGKGIGKRYRLIGTVRDERAERAASLRFEDVGQQALAGLGVQVGKVNWFSTYHVHHRIAASFRINKVFLLGDAAHVHSPAGGQGMNTGILDAINLAWKLAAVLKGQAPDSLLDTYASERQAFARKLVDTTDRLFTMVTSDSGVAEFVKTHIAPLFVKAAYRFDTVRELMFRIVSQMTLEYHDSPLSAGKAGEIHGGDRLPWVNVDGHDNFAAPPTIGWQLHVMGQASAALHGCCDRLGVLLREFAWQAEYAHAGFVRDGACLLRPDSWVALADPTASPEVLERYFAERGIDLRAAPASTQP